MSRLFDDAASEYLNIAQAVLAEPPFAMVCFFQIDAGGKNHSLMAIYDKDVTDQIHILYVYDAAPDIVRAYSDDGGGAGSAASTLEVTTDTWFHAAGIWASTTDRRAFTNGANKGTDATDITPANLDSTALSKFGAETAYLSGLIAEAAIWDLSDWPGATASDKADVFETILPSLAAGYSPLFFPLGLKAYWPLIRYTNDRVGGYNLA